MKKRDLISLFDLDDGEFQELLELSNYYSSTPSNNGKELHNKIIGIYFKKTSTRTRSSFSAGALRLGAQIISYGPNDLQTNTGESIQDTARVLSGYIDGFVARTCEPTIQFRIMAKHCSIPCINAMSTEEHPTQAIGDFALLKDQFGSLAGVHLLYIGAGNNTAAALAAAASKISDFKATFLTPKGYGLGQTIGIAQQAAQRTGAIISEYHNFNDCPSIKADAVYTTRWITTGTSYHQESWREDFAPFAVTEKLMEEVSKNTDTVFLHDLPAVRGEDVSTAVLEGNQSVAFKQANYKLYSAMAVLKWAIG